MTNTQMVGLGVRLFAAWLAVYILRNAPSYVLFSSQEFSFSETTVIVVATGAMVLIGMLLWFFPLRVASGLIPESTNSQGTSFSLEELERTGFCLLGLWVLTQAIPLCIRSGYIFYYALQPNSLLVLGVNEHAVFLHSLAQLAIGVWLLFGAKGLLGLLRWARHAGT